MLQIALLLQMGFDTSSFSSDSYNKNSANGNHHKQISMGQDERRKSRELRDPRYASHSRAMSYENYHSSKLHDPYRFTRSTAQPMGTQRGVDKPRYPDAPPQQQKYRPPQEEMRPVPPPKPASYHPRYLYFSFCFIYFLHLSHDPMLYLKWLRLVHFMLGEFKHFLG